MKALHIIIGNVALVAIACGVWFSANWLVSDVGWSVHATTVVYFWGGIGFFRLGEIIYAWRPSWSLHKKDMLLDFIGHGIVTNGVVGLITTGVVLGALQWCSEAIQTLHSGPLWPHHLPMAVQVFAAVAIGDFGFYWIHRWAHGNRYGWAVHATHHSSHRLYVGSSFRNHPLNVLGAFIAQNAANTLLGVGDQVAMLANIYVMVFGMLQHSNIGWRFGWLNYVFATPELHRFHHSKVRSEELSNYAGTFSFWDLIFGTFYYAPERDGPELTGIEGLRVRRNYWEHLALPWRLLRGQ